MCIRDSFKADRDVTLRGEIVDLVRLHLLDDADQAGGIGEVAVMQDEAPPSFVRVLIEMIDTIGIEQRRPCLLYTSRCV